MFKDPSDIIKEEVEAALETWDFEEILEHNDMTIEEALIILVENGFIQLPEISSVR